MLRKTGVSILISALASPVYAGFYVGAAIGPEGASFDQTAQVVGNNSSSPHGSFFVVDKNGFSGTGGFGSVFAGYGLTRDRFYLAAEANGNLSSVMHQLTNDEYLHGTISKTTFTVKSSEGLSLLPGYFVSQDTLFYARLGWISGQIRINESDTSIQSYNGSRNGIRYGLGIRHALTQQWIAMMDYSQINYQNIKSFTYDPVGMVAKTTSITPNTAQVAFGLLYSFDQPAKAYVK